MGCSVLCTVGWVVWMLCGCIGSGGMGRGLSLCPGCGCWVKPSACPGVGTVQGGSGVLVRVARGLLPDLGWCRFGCSVSGTQGHAGFGLGCGKIGKNFWHRCRIWPPPRARGGALRAGGRTHNAVYNPISTSISRFFFSYDTCFLFLSSDYQAHVNYDDFSFYYNDSKERKNIYIYRDRERKKSAFLTCAIFVPMDVPFWYKKEEPGVTSTYFWL